MPERYRLTMLKRLVSTFLSLILLVGCTLAPSMPVATSTSTIVPGNGDLSDDEIATLSSLEQLDDYPLYTMQYRGAYPEASVFAPGVSQAETDPLASPGACQASWGCSLFAALGGPDNRLYGRNYDYRFSPAVLLFTDPLDGYASVSMVDIEYLGFGGSQAKGLTDLPLIERRALLEAPSLPFDGMNEKGLAIGMAAVPPGDMRQDPNKETIGELGVIREILDHASTVEEAVNMLARYNIDMSELPLHYLIASASGNSALVEFFQGKMVVFQNEGPWQAATNFLVASTDGQPQGQCPRYDRVSRRLQEKGGQFSLQDAFSLLEGVSQHSPQAQSPTQWSIVYNMTSGEINVVMGQEYNGGVHTLLLSLSGQ